MAGIFFIRLTIIPKEKKGNPVKRKFLERKIGKTRFRKISLYVPMAIVPTRRIGVIIKRGLYKLYFSTKSIMTRMYI